MTVTRLEPAGFDWSSGSGGAAEVRRIWAAATSADGRSPLDEAALLSLRHQGLETGIILIADIPGGSTSNEGRLDLERRAAEPRTEGGSTSNEGRLGGFAYVRGLSGAGRPELDLVVDPDVRGRGIGSALGQAVVELTDGIPITAWSHGNHPAARALAQRLAFASVRELWLMRRSSSAPMPDATLPPGVTIRPFRPGTSDEADFLAVNAAAFASHPEQGTLDQAGLAERMAEPWFDADGFLLAVHDSRVVGFHWTKVHPASGDHPAYGEVYVIGVDPHAQAGGLGRALLAAGLRHLHEGRLDLHDGRLDLNEGRLDLHDGRLDLHDGRLDEVVLYVEAENSAAIGLYESFGFTHAARDTDVMYASV